MVSRFLPQRRWGWEIGCAVGPDPGVSQRPAHPQRQPARTPDPAAPPARPSILLTLTLRRARPAESRTGVLVPVCGTSGLLSVSSPDAALRPQQLLRGKKEDTLTQLERSQEAELLSKCIVVGS